MIHEFAKNRPTVDVIREQLGMEPEAFDKDFLAMIDKETGKTVAGFADWTKQVREINQLDEGRQERRSDRERPRDRRPVSGLRGERQRLFLRRGSLPEEGRQGLRDGRTGALFEDRRPRSRDDEEVREASAGCGEAQGSGSGAGAVELTFSRWMRNCMSASAACCWRPATRSGAVREYQALIAMHPIDAAGSHYNLARAYKAAGQKDQAREEAVTALEAAPNFKPAQKLLLEVSGDERRKIEKSSCPQCYPSLNRTF